MNLFDLYAKITLDDSDFNRGVDRVKKAFGGTEQTLTAKAVAIGNAMYKMGEKALSALSGLGSMVIESGNNFDAAMANVAAISGATGEALDALSEKAKKMGAATKFSASEAADAFTYMAMAGWKTEDMFSGIEGVMNLAAASGEDLAAVSDIVTDALTAFGMAASDSAQFADVLAAASNSANTNVSMLGESFKYVAPVAGALGYTVEDTSVALGLMANSGIKASQAGTALRAALNSMISPSKDAGTYMDMLGISMVNNDGTAKSLASVMDNLREAFSHLTEAEQAESAATIFGTEAMSGMLAIVNASDSDFAKLTEAINNSSGTAKLMADTMNNNLPGALTIAKSALEGMAISLYETFSGDAQSAVEKFTGMVAAATPIVTEFVRAVIDNGPEIISVISGLTAATLAYKAAVGISKIIDSVRTATESMTIAQAALNAVMKANPLALVVSLIASVGTALVTLFATNEEFRTKVVNVWNTVTSTISAAVSVIVKFFTETIPKAAQAAVDWIGGKIPEQMREVGRDLIEGIWNGITDKVEWLKGKVAGVVDTIKGWFTGKEGFDEHSPSKWSEKVFQNIMEGGGIGLEKGASPLLAEVRSVTDRVKDSMELDTATVDFTSSGTGRATAGMVNSITSALHSGSGGSYTFNLMLPNGTVLASYLLGPLAEYAKANGTPILNPA